ncbi:MAG: YggS family pyridoxal phosphate enzyme [Omnitrophica WOR_2 bacterium RIFCSPHIGHO2_02_FULL_45_21]|nr:MAG: YggS family pyridoxal phosphate enzyme [Omnitrophica WOR_2 bacterium RIFCSPHIGHO2_02_FULL_45_21]
MIKQNLSAIKAKIASVCARTGRNPQEITLVAVSKGRSIDSLREVIEAGITDIGENKVQEALHKYNMLHATCNLQRVRWHMLGHLQTNKAKEAVKLFDLIQSVDSLRLAAEINRQSGKLKKIQDILVEVNLSAESSKFGIKPEQAEEVIREMSEFKNLNIKGLMGIAPIVDLPKKTRPYFRMLKKLRGVIHQPPAASRQPLILSMGMSSDFEIAIEEGADMLRLGRAIFGALN